MTTSMIDIRGFLSRHRNTKINGASCPTSLSKFVIMQLNRTHEELRESIMRNRQIIRQHADDIAEDGQKLADDPATCLTMDEHGDKLAKYIMNVMMGKDKLKEIQKKVELWIMAKEINEDINVCEHEHLTLIMHLYDVYRYCYLNTTLMRDIIYKVEQDTKITETDGFVYEKLL